MVGIRGNTSCAAIKCCRATPARIFCRLVDTDSAAFEARSFDNYCSYYSSCSRSCSCYHNSHYYKFYYDSYCIVYFFHFVSLCGFCEYRYYQSDQL